MHTTVEMFLHRSHRKSESRTKVSVAYAVNYGIMTSV